MLSGKTLGGIAGVDEGLALVWLHTLDKAGYIKPRYSWYCPVTENLLAVTPTNNPVLYCPDCDKSHDNKTEAFVELSFVQA
jgi:hypothetical protein